LSSSWFWGGVLVIVGHLIVCKAGELVKQEAAIVVQEGVNKVGQVVEGLGIWLADAIGVVGGYGLLLPLVPEVAAMAQDVNILLSDVVTLSIGLAGLVSGTTGMVGSTMMYCTLRMMVVVTSWVYQLPRH
jgi:hypothetical protein